ncbi:transcription factor GTE3, chloroplastic [Lathyrus oleraceus]|uniref:transcription factor GTE3, chloroplastic n=1 Tax=Pisum sativum TaxID=3888 RepID=UPI0021D3B441|nr:transcription factor GTE3, chloroplastic-like [Pisum sativum]
MSEKTQPRKRLIVKLSYPPGSRKLLSQTKDSNIVVENKKIIKNQVSNTVTSQPKGSNIVVENKKIIKIKNQVSNTVTSQPKDSNIVVENKKILKNQVSNTIPLSQPKDNDNVVEDKKILKNQVSKTEIAFNGPKESSRHCSKPASVTRGEECGLKEPMDGVKRRQCWLILKRMLVDRDGWVLKDPPKIAKSDKCKTKAIGLKEIERKMRLYATPDEFASDMRLVFSNAMVTYPPRNHIYQIAKKFSDTFEHKWKSLKNMWELEDTKRSNTHKRY